ncbi:MAG TPA: hypothetical protein VH988_25045 [Thermoanaerobaculia bacterium]|jgi:hypothetical protein|nr:hypothetical protein [Thermoanaerobaculia bacterium]
MKQSKPQFAPVLRSLLEDDARAAGHATPEQLLDHHAGRLSPDQSDLLNRHLQGCQECAGLFRELAEFAAFTPAPAAEALADREAQAAWRRLSARLPKAEAAPHPRPVPIAAGRRKPKQDDFAYEPQRLRGRPRSTFLLAAGLMATVVGLGAWVALLEMRVHRLSQPSVNVAMLELHTDAVRSAERPVIAGGGDSVVFLLDPPDGQSSTQLRAEIRKAGAAEPLVRAGGLHKAENGTLNLQVSRSVLPPGDYQLDLFQENAGSTPLASYPFSVSSP